MSNKFYDLVSDLESGELSTTHVQQALKVYYGKSKYLPKEIKDLVCGATNVTGVIERHFQAMQSEIGALELAYRRAKDYAKGDSKDEAST